MSELTKEVVEQLLAYDPETGEFRWKVSRGTASAGRRAGCNNGRGYTHIRLLRKNRYAHRLAFLLMTGRLPLEQIDHKDGDRANNRWENLRVVTATENQQNRKQAQRNNASGFLGVTACTNSKKNPWAARIIVGYKKLHLGVFLTPEEAHAAYLAAKRELHPAYIHKEE